MKGWGLALLLALAGCVQPELVPDEPGRPLLPEEVYKEAARKGAAVYRIETPESHVLVRVGRDGKLKNLGHDHVIASDDIEGLVMLHEDSAESRSDLLIPLQLLIVDKAEYRAQIGLEGEVSESAIGGTSGNMHDKVLESSLYPWVQVSVRFASAQSDPPTLSVSVTLRGTAFDYVVPVDLQVAPDKLVISGDMTMQHEDFGLTPFSAAGGLLKVAGQLDLQFKLVARRM